MTASAKRILARAAELHGLAIEEWEHVLTTMADDKSGIFVYDHADGSVLRVTVRESIETHLSRISESEES